MNLKFIMNGNKSLRHWIKSAGTKWKKSSGFGTNQKNNPQIKWCCNTTNEVGKIGWEARQPNERRERHQWSWRVVVSGWWAQLWHPCTHCHSETHGREPMKPPEPDTTIHKFWGRGIDNPKTEPFANEMKLHEIKKKQWWEPNQWTHGRQIWQIWEAHDGKQMGEKNRKHVIRNQQQNTKNCTEPDIIIQAGENMLGICKPFLTKRGCAVTAHWSHVSCVSQLKAKVRSAPNCCNDHWNWHE